MILLLSYFSDEGVPQEGLSPTIRIRKVSDGSLIITDEDMTEIGDGFYKYEFTGFVDGNRYSARADGGSFLNPDDRYTIGEIEEYDFPEKINQIIDTLQFLKDIQGGKWQITGNQMIFFKADNVTEIARFNLYDKVGPSETNVIMRTRV